MIVFAFDRDWTVDVNPHPEKAAVPLEWVRVLAHGTRHAVYAIGNQDLASEAAIPGVVDVVGRHERDWDDLLGTKQPDGRYERFPSRRERLSLIADLHPDADRYVVVDDVDLRDVEGWDHYHAWEFVPAVRDGDVDPALPWVEHPTGPDLPTTAGIAPLDADHLESFLDEHADAPLLWLTYEDGDARRGVLLTGVSRYRPAVAAYECEPVDPRVDSFRVHRTDVRRIHAVDCHAGTATRGGDSPWPAPNGLLSRAREDPDGLAPLDLQEALSSDDDATRRVAHVATALVAADDAARSLPLLPTLAGSLSATGTERRFAVSALALVAAEHPADVAPYAERLSPCLVADDPRTVAAACDCAASLASHDPVDAVALTTELAAVLDSGGPGLPDAAYALNCVAGATPDAVAPVTASLAAVFGDGDRSDGARLNAVAALGRVTSEDPDAAVDHVDDIVDLLDSENPTLQANAAGALSDLATVHTADLVPAVDRWAELLAGTDAYVLSNTAAGLARVAELHPDAVAPHAEALVELLDHDDALVRENACWALGYAGDADALAALRDMSGADSDADVRERARWAFQEIASESPVDAT